MILKLGDCIKVKTKTLKNVFGECVYKVVEVGILSPNKERRAQGIMDGIKFMMLGGTGPSARYGFIVMDFESNVAQNIADGITVVLSEAEALKAEQFYKHGGAAASSKTGVVEM